MREGERYEGTRIRGYISPGSQGTYSVTHTEWQHRYCYLHYTELH